MMNLTFKDRTRLQQMSLYLYGTKNMWRRIMERRNITVEQAEQVMILHKEEKEKIIERLREANQAKNDDSKNEKTEVPGVSQSVNVEDARDNES